MVGCYCVIIPCCNIKLKTEFTKHTALIYLLWIWGRKKWHRICFICQIYCHIQAELLHCLVLNGVCFYLLTGRFWTVGMAWRDGRLGKSHQKLDSFTTTTSKSNSLSEAPLLSSSLACAEPYLIELWHLNSKAFQCQPVWWVISFKKCNMFIFVLIFMLKKIQAAKRNGWCQFTTLWSAAICLLTLLAPPVHVDYPDHANSYAQQLMLWALEYNP